MNEPKQIFKEKGITLIICSVMAMMVYASFSFRDFKWIGMLFSGILGPIILAIIYLFKKNKDENNKTNKKGCKKDS